MAEHHHAVIQMEQHVFGAPRDPLDPPALQPCGELRRQREAQIGPPLDHAAKAPALQAGGEAAANCFDFRQFGHCLEFSMQPAARRGHARSGRLLLPPSIADFAAAITPCPDSTPFGFRDVDPADKAGMVRGVFESVAARYDLMNDLMSAGVHRLWKSVLIDLLAPRDGEHFIDVAGGTGDIAFRILARLKQSADASVTVCDLTPAMLETGRARAIDRGLLQRHRLDRRQCREPAVRRPQLRCLYDRLRLAQCHAYRQGAGGSPARAEARRAVLLPRVQPCGERAAVEALRSLFLRAAAAAGAVGRGRPGFLSVPGGEHPPLSAAARAGCA